jgi:hypothetical protein
MTKENLWNKSVTRVEYDHRAREARLQLERVERLLVKHYAVKDSRPVRLLRLLAHSISGSGRRGDRRTRSPSDRWPCPIMRVPLPVAWPLGGPPKIRDGSPAAAHILRPQLGVCAVELCQSSRNMTQLRSGCASRKRAPQRARTKSLN